MWRCVKLPKSPSIRNAIILCGTNNIQYDTTEDIVDGILEVALTLRRKYHLINAAICGLIPHDDNWSINRIYINEINNDLPYKCKQNGFTFIDKKDWTLQDGSLKPNLFYVDKLHLAEDGNAKLAESIVNAINTNVNNYKNATTSSNLLSNTKEFHFNQEDFPPLFVRNAVCNPVRPVVKWCSNTLVTSKSVNCHNVRLNKPVGSCNVRTIKPVCSRNVRPSKLANTSNVNYSKPICTSNVNYSKPVCTSNVNYSKPVCTSNVNHSKPVCTSNVNCSIPVCTSNVNYSKPVCTSNVNHSKLVCTSNVNYSKHVCTSNVNHSKLVCTSNVNYSKHVCTSNVNHSKPVCTSNVNHSQPVCTSNVNYSQPVCTSNVNYSKPVCTSNVNHTKPVCTSGVVRSKPACTRNVCKSKQAVQNVNSNKVVFPVDVGKPHCENKSMILPAECCIYYLKFLLLLFLLPIFLVSMMSSTFHVIILNSNIIMNVHMTLLISRKFFKCKYIFETLFKILSKVFYRHLYIYLTTINFLNFCLLFDIAHSIKPNLFFVVVVILIPTKIAMLNGSKFHKHIKNCLYNINFIVFHMLRKILCFTQLTLQKLIDVLFLIDYFLYIADRIFNFLITTFYYL